MRTTVKSALLILTAIFLIACGGGGGGSNNTATIDDQSNQDVNTPNDNVDQPGNGDSSGQPSTPGAGDGSGAGDSGEDPGNGSDTGSSDDEVEQFEVSGYAVKGVLANAQVEVYMYSPNKGQRHMAVKNFTPNGRTNAEGAFENVIVDRVRTGPAFVVVRAVEGTIDLTTGEAPEFESLTAVVPWEELGDYPVYVSPLSTLISNLAIEFAGRERLNGLYSFFQATINVVTDEEFFYALESASMQALSVFAPGLPRDTSIPKTPLLVVDSTSTTEDQAQIATLRGANEVLAAITLTLANSKPSVDGGNQFTANEVLRAVAKDLGDGEINGEYNPNRDPNHYYGLQEMPGEAETQRIMLAGLSENVPGTSIPVSDVELVIVDESADTGTTGEYKALEDGTVQAEMATPRLFSDADGDGTPDYRDTSVRGASAS